MTDQPPADGTDDFDAEDDAEATYEQMKAELADWRDKAMRAVAEAENTKRRAERESNDAKAFAIQRFAKDLFGAADNLERALQAAHGVGLADSSDPAVKNLILGIEMTEKALQSAFERNALKKIDPAKGEKFDPHSHQAMMEQDDPSTEPGAVIQTMQAGYELFGRNLRPAMVIVAAKRPGAGSTAAAGDGANPYAQPGEQASGGSVDTKA